jgi:hypothetical protein
MAYVAMTRGRDTNEAFIYHTTRGERDHDHTTPITEPDIHTLRRGNGYAAAHHFRQILAHDDRPHTMDDHAQTASATELPIEIRELLERNTVRLRSRQAEWREQTVRASAFRAGYERAITSIDAGVDRSDDGYEL